jgi:uncharacterized protein (DUF1015 family)
MGVPRFEPFAAVRYDHSRVEPADVLAPPYDVIGADELQRLESRSPYNVVHIDLARDDPARNRYDAARCRMQEWIEAGVLLRDDEPAFYLYRMGWHDEDGRPLQTTGVLGALALDPERSGQVLPHERTMAKPMDDRLRLMRACRANLSPIWGLSLGTGLDAVAPPPEGPLLRVTDDGGVHHRLWRLSGRGTIETVQASVGAGPVVIADGHHRYETALAYQAERRAAGAGAGPHDLTLAFVSDLASMEAGVRPIHRLIGGLPEHFPVREAMAASFLLLPVPGGPEALPGLMVARGGLGLVVGREAYVLQPRVTAGETVDSELLELALTPFPAHTTRYHHDVAEVLVLLDKGEAQAAVLLRPTSVGQIEAAAREGRRLPQKSTFFHPKPRTGVAFRLLDEPPP